MDKKVMYLGIILVVGFIAVISYLVYLEGLKPGVDDNFAKCLTENGVIMAGTDGCSYCKQQKAMFMNSFKFINYKNCDLDPNWCSENGVTNYPTWFDAEGNKSIGVQTFDQLSEMSGCEVTAG